MIIIDILMILAMFVLGYAIFISSTYFLAKWMLPKIEDEDFAFSESNETPIRHAVKADHRRGK
jgi:hypothetical protein